jgi:hypothetical protein
MVICWIGAPRPAREVFGIEIEAIDAMAQRVLAYETDPSFRNGQAFGYSAKVSGDSKAGA